MGFCKFMWQKSESQGGTATGIVIFKTLCRDFTRDRVDKRLKIKKFMVPYFEFLLNGNLMFEDQ